MFRMIRTFIAHAQEFRYAVLEQRLSEVYDQKASLLNSLAGLSDIKHRMEHNPTSVTKAEKRLAEHVEWTVTRSLPIMERTIERLEKRLKQNPVSSPLPPTTNDPSY